MRTGKEGPVDSSVIDSPKLFGRNLDSRAGRGGQLGEGPVNLKGDIRGVLENSPAEEKSILKTKTEARQGVAKLFFGIFEVTVGGGRRVFHHNKFKTVDFRKVETIRATLHPGGRRKNVNAEK